MIGEMNHHFIMDSRATNKPNAQLNARYKNAKEGTKMKKKLGVGKRMLAFMLTFAMVFTAISWGESGSVKADVTNLLTDGDMESGNALNGRDINVGTYIYDNVIDSVNVVSEDLHDGQYALQIKTKAETDLYLNCSEISGLDASKTYVFSGYVKLASETSNVWVGDGDKNKNGDKKIIRHGAILMVGNNSHMKLQQKPHAPRVCMHGHQVEPCC